jgi:hypothetical protein
VSYGALPGSVFEVKAEDRVSVTLLDSDTVGRCAIDVLGHHGDRSAVGDSL